jgi:hypothetical protein
MMDQITRDMVKPEEVTLIYTFDSEDRQNPYYGDIVSLCNQLGIRVHDLRDYYSSLTEFFSNLELGI